MGLSLVLDYHNPIRYQIRSNLKPLVLLYGPLLILLTAVGFVGRDTDESFLAAPLETIPVNVQFFTRDPTATLHAPFYTGFLSNLGIIFWCFGAAVAWLALAVAKKTTELASWVSFFRYAAVLTTVLMLDDFFLFHEEIFPDYLFPEDGFLHLNEKFVQVIYTILILVFLFRYRPMFAKTDTIFLILGLGFFGVALLADRGFSKAIIPDKQLRALAEDGSKLLGIAGWSMYFALTAFRLLSHGVGKSVKLATTD